jgi:transposase
MALPTLTPEQRAEALQKAQEARSARKQLLDQVKAGELTLAQVLAKGKDDPVVAKTKVSALVQAVPGCGVVRAAAVLAEAKVAEGRRVGGLGAKQHDALLSALS